MNSKSDERTLDLLSEQALYGLNDEQFAELRSLDSGALGSMDAQELEFAAAQLSLIGIEDNAQLPEHLFQKIVAESQDYVGVENNIFTQPRVVSVAAERPSMGVFGWLGWAAAAAACVALAVTIFNDQRNDQIARDQTPPIEAKQELTAAQLRQKLIETGQALVRAEWSKGTFKESEGISGDVVWSDSTQTGYMRISGLPVNDKSRAQYQLWIFENAELEEHPKDGGVFDVNENGEVIIPIDAKIAVRDPKAFAITVEKPGGVVVSKRGQIAGLAPVKPSQT